MWIVIGTCHVKEKLHKINKYINITFQQQTSKTVKKACGRMCTCLQFFNVTLHNSYLKCNDNIKMEAYSINIIIILVTFYTQWKFFNNSILFVAFKKN